MSTAEDDHKTKDLANSAAIVAEAARNAPARDLDAVRTPYGEATVILDDNGADVVLHRQNVTVHIRREN